MVTANPAAVIVGTGRSGSKFIARVLSVCGIPCGHEQVFGFGRDRRHLLVESSWLAVAYLPVRARVWHQVRHPEAVIRSRLAAPLDAVQQPYAEFRRRWLPETGDRVVDAMRWYVTWNLACERWATRRWRVEDVDGKLMETLAADLSVDCDPAGIERVPRDLNRHGAEGDTGWSLDDLPAGADRDAVHAMGERYGYL